MTHEAASFEDAAIAHLRDALSVPVSERWRWLQQAVGFGAATARTRAVKGQVTLGPHGELMWSPLHEAVWAREHRLPSEAELATWTAELCR